MLKGPYNTFWTCQETLPVTRGGFCEHVSQILLHYMQQGICSLVSRYILKAPALLSTKHIIIGLDNEIIWRTTIGWLSCAVATYATGWHHILSVTLATSLSSLWKCEYVQWKREVNVQGHDTSSMLIMTKEVKHAQNSVTPPIPNIFEKILHEAIRAAVSSLTDVTWGFFAKVFRSLFKELLKVKYGAFYCCHFVDFGHKGPVSTQSSILWTLHEWET